VTAIAIGLTLMWSAGHRSTLHVHAYFDHDHPEHHHGLAAHEHHPAGVHDDDHEEAGAGLKLESCDPGTHVVTVAMACAQLPPVQVVDGESGDLTVLPELVPQEPWTERTDVRVHGPPGLSQTSPRGPPIHLPRLIT
jgi:hypothetical protein